MPDDKDSKVGFWDFLTGKHTPEPTPTPDPSAKRNVEDTSMELIEGMYGFGSQSQKKKK